MKKIKFYVFLLTVNIAFSQKMIIPMDQSQNNHLKAYGIVYSILEKSINIEWLLNYRGGSFLVDSHQFIQTECRIKGVTFENVDSNSLINIYSTIDQNNMDISLL